MATEGWEPTSPYTVTITWAVGDSVVLDYPDLMPWEARAILEQAIEQTRVDEEESEDADAE